MSRAQFCHPTEEQRTTDNGQRFPTARVRDYFPVAIKNEALHRILEVKHDKHLFEQNLNLEQAEFSSLEPFQSSRPRVFRAKLDSRYF